VRGTDVERPISGDMGVSGTFEATTPELATGLRALGFVDAGYIRNQDAGPAPTLKPVSDRLASVGLGLRYAGAGFAASLDYGRIVLGSRVATTLNSASPQRGDDRFYLNLSYRF
jgi:hypothetical protein